MFKIGAIAYIYESDITDTDNKRAQIMDQFDTLMYLSLGNWMDKNAPSFKEKVNIADIRMKAYDQTMSQYINNPFVMHYISLTLYWFLSEGWTRRQDGSLSTFPNSEFDMLSAIRIGKNEEKKYSDIVEQTDAIVLGYCDNKIATFILNIYCKISV